MSEGMTISIAPEVVYLISLSEKPMDRNRFVHILLEAGVQLDVSEHSKFSEALTGNVS